MRSTVSPQSSEDPCGNAILGIPEDVVRPDAPFRSRGSAYTQRILRGIPLQGTTVTAQNERRHVPDRHMGVKVPFCTNAICGPANGCGGIGDSTAPSGRYGHQNPSQSSRAASRAASSGNSGPGLWK